MKQGNLAILDAEEAYLRRLGQYLNESDFMALKVSVFSDSEKFEKFLERERTALILVGESLWKKEYEERESIVLYENPFAVPEYEPHIYKYQSAREIGQEIMDRYAKSVGKSFSAKGKKSVLYGIFPIGEENTGTVLAWEMAKYLSRDKRVLFLSQKAFSGMKRRLSENWSRNLADCIFFLRRGEGSPAIKMQAVICHGERLDYIPPMESEEDINSVSREEWTALLESIGKGLDYESIVLDLSEGAQGFSFWLEACDYIFTPVSGELSATRAEERRTWLESRLEKEQLQKWIVCPGDLLKIREPYGWQQNPELMQYVKRILDGNGVFYGEI